MAIVRLTKAVVPSMKARSWGRIITIASTTVQQPKEDLLISGPGKNPDYNFYRVAGMAIAGKPKGSAQNEAEPINVKSLLP